MSVIPTVFRLALPLMLCGIPQAQAQQPDYTVPVHASAEQKAPPPVAAFFANTKFGGAKLSPDARHVAARSHAMDGRDFLVVVDLEKNTGEIVAWFAKSDVTSFEWVNNERLVFTTDDRTRAAGDKLLTPGLYAVNHDGGNLQRLIEHRSWTEQHRFTGIDMSSRTWRRYLPWNTYLLGQPGRQDAGHVYVVKPQFDMKNRVYNVDLLRMNAYTGFSQVVPRPGKTRSWMLDHDGEPRLATTLDGARVVLHYREPTDGKWRPLASYAAYGDERNALAPLGFGADGTLYVVTRAGGDNTAVHALDVATGKLRHEPLLSVPGYDFDGALVRNRSGILGAQVRSDALSSEWFDPAMKLVQAAVDKALPATVNVVSVPAETDSPWVMVSAYADRLPPVLFLYNKVTDKLNKIAHTHPQIHPAAMGRQRSAHYLARDGLGIPALLTLPPSAEPVKLPLVVLVHGGPHARGSSWGWNAQSQFLASRGYAVLQPEFRGSTGFGAEHAEAGWKQWGLAMQDDIADGVRWAVEQGIADAGRVCIAGGGYGGYASLMGLVNDHELYRCGISWTGVTDLGMLFERGQIVQTDANDQYRSHGLQKLIGDPLEDAARFEATSPLRQAARIQRPLLLAYGGVDRNVPIQHGARLRDAVQRSNAQVEWVEYPDEGHVWTKENNRIDFWTRVEKFLDLHIGSRALP